MARANTKTRPATGLPKPKASDLYPKWDELPVLVEMSFDEKVARRRELRELVDVREAELKALNSDIEAALVVAEQKGVKIGEYVVTRCNGRSAAKFSNAKAVELGLDADLVAQCWIPGGEYTYIQIKHEGEKEK